MRNIFLYSLLVTISNLVLAQNPNIVNPSDSFTIIEPGVTTIADLPFQGTLGPASVEEDLEKYRRLIWVHGLTGDKNSWINAGSACQDQKPIVDFPARRVQSEYPEYGESGTVSAAASQLHGQIFNYCAIQETDEDFEDCSKNIVFAHSQGGVVSRSLLYNHFCLNGAPYEDLGFGGLATFNTPNLGAKILNNAHLADKMLTDLCSSLIAGPSLEKAYDFIGDFYLALWAFDDQTDWILQENIDVFDNIICEKLEEALFYQLSASAMPPITEDYKIGSAWINHVNEGCNDVELAHEVKKLAFYGVESDMQIDMETGTFTEPEGLIFRTLWYQIVSPNHPQYGYFGANEDHALFPLIEKVVAPYMAKEEEYLSEIENRELKMNNWQCHEPWIYTIGAWATICEVLKAKQRKAKAILKAYQRGVLWFNTVDEKFKQYIGAVQYKKSSDCNCFVFDDELGVDLKEYYAGAMDFNGKFYEACETIPGLRICEDEQIYYQRIYEHNDGIVLESSQKGNHTLVHEPILLSNTSHMQARNNEALRVALLNIFDGAYDGFFTTSPK